MAGFEGFELTRVDVGEVQLRVRVGGSGPPLLLLHGYPETHLMWAPVAADLAQDFTVVAPDLRGYGESSQPPTVPDHETFGKRAMAADGVALMAGWASTGSTSPGTTAAGGWPTGWRWTTPDAVRRLTVLDVVPTGEVWARADARFALGYWHWAFLAQPEPLPETVIGARPGAASSSTRSSAGELRSLRPRGGRRLPRALRRPGGGARHLRGLPGRRHLRPAARRCRPGGRRRITAPLQVLWGGRGALPAWYDPLEVWRPLGRGRHRLGVDSGHFLVEEPPRDPGRAAQLPHGGTLSTGVRVRR